jgi:ribonuclease P protein subunit POP4
MAPNPSLALLARAQSPTRAQELFSEKVLLRPLYLKPTPASEATSTTTPDARDPRQRARAQRQLAKRKSPGKPRPLSAKQKRALQVYNIPKSQQKWAIFEPVWRMWCGYIREILGLNVETPYNAKGRSKWLDPKNAGPLLAGADFHGAKVKVVRSRCLSRVGLEGIVIRDTKFTFEIVTEKDEIKVVPKEHTVFQFGVPAVEDKDETGQGYEKEEGQDVIERPKPFIFELYGHFFQTRAPERASKKFVLHLPPDL